MADADRMHRAEGLELHPDDAAAQGIADGDSVTLSGNGASLTANVTLNPEATPGTALLPLLWQAGAVQALIGADDGVPSVELSKS